MRIYCVVWLQNEACDWHDLGLLNAFLLFVTEDFVAGSLKNFIEIALVSPDSILFLVEQELAGLRRILFDKNETTFLTIRAFGQTFGFCVDEVVNDVLVWQVAENPLDPDSVIFAVVSKLLNAFVVEGSSK